MRVWALGVSILRLCKSGYVGFLGCDIVFHISLQECKVAWGSGLWSLRIA